MIKICKLWRFTLDKGWFI